MITCSMQYLINPSRLDEFEHYGRLWMALVRKYNGTHHGFFVPLSEESDVAMAHYTFPSLSEYAIYISATLTDPECIGACEYAKSTGCILQMDRNFYRPVSDHKVY
jgi:hypothetical protein